MNDEVYFLHALKSSTRSLHAFKSSWNLLLILSFWVSVTRHAQSTQKKFAYLCNICNISIKSWWMKLIFCLQINTKVFYKIIVSLWVYVTTHAQSTKISKFTISLQYFNENVKDGSWFFACWQMLKISSK